MGNNHGPALPCHFIDVASQDKTSEPLREQLRREILQVGANLVQHVGSVNDRNGKESLAKDRRQTPSAKLIRERLHSKRGDVLHLAKQRRNPARGREADDWIPDEISRDSPRLF